MDMIQTVIMAVVEGLTEFLPVSSTGHMIIAQQMMGVPSTDFVKAFTIIIQFGAILSVVIYYWKRFFTSWDFYKKLLIAFIPAAVFGFVFSNLIDSFLENVWVVATMLVLGGVVMLFVDKWFNDSKASSRLSDKGAFKIGLFQCIAMIPGVSRSMATIVGGMAQGLTRKAAAEFSFFLAVPTMFAATSYKILKLIMDPNGIQIIKDNMLTLLVGNVVAFIVALLAIRFFISFITKFGFKAFGYYRILVGGVILILMLLGYNLEVL
ncbi:MAG: undecaprenyl-diphosphate phosphatase [Bacteroidales bacterium]